MRAQFKCSSVLFPPTCASYFFLFFLVFGGNTRILCVTFLIKTQSISVQFNGRLITVDTQGHSWPELGKEVPGECAFFWEGVQYDWNRAARAKTERTAWIWGHNGVWQWLASYHGEELLALAWNMSNPADTKWKLLMVRLSCTAGGKGPPPSPGLRRTDSDWLAHLSSKTDRQAHRERQTVSWQPRSPPHSDIIHTEIFYPSYKLTFLCSLKDVINKFWRLFKVPPPSYVWHRRSCNAGKHSVERQTHQY